jgi:hypothetical protein
MNFTSNAVAVIIAVIAVRANPGAVLSDINNIFALAVAPALAPALVDSSIFYCVLGLLDSLRYCRLSECASSLLLWQACVSFALRPTHMHCTE